MKLFVLGATGATGTELVSQALAAGDEVTAYVRDPAKMTVTDPHLTVVGGSITDTETLAAAMAGHDAVVCVIGSGRKTTTLIDDSMRAVVPAAENAAVRRFVLLSAFGVGDSLSKGGRIARLAYGTIVKGVYADKLRGEATVRASDLDWTFAYPVTLNSKPATGSYIATTLAETPQLPGTPSMTRGDLATFLLRTAKDDSYSRQVVVLR